MVRYSIAGNVYAVLDTNDNATASTGRRCGAEMEQNRFGHCAELVFLGLYTDSGTHMTCTAIAELNEKPFFLSIYWQVLGGYFSDKIGGQRVIFFAAIGWSLITFWMPNILMAAPKSWTYSIPFIVFIRIFNGACQGVHFPSMISLTSQNLSASERTSFFSLLTSGSAIGTLLTGILGSFILDYFGWPSVFRIIGKLSAFTKLIRRTQNYNVYWCMCRIFGIGVGAGYALLYNVFRTLSRHQFVCTESIVHQQQEQRRLGTMAETIWQSFVLGMCAGPCLPK